MNQLPYWRPIEYSVIEVMHGLILGNLKDHSQSYLQMAWAGEELSKAQVKGRNTREEIMSQSSISKTDERFKGKKRQSQDDELEQEESVVATKKRRVLTSRNLQRLSKVCEEQSAIGSTSKYQLRSSSVGYSSSSRLQSTIDSNQSSSTHHYSLCGKGADSQGSRASKI